jgi:16S rRNA G966 N2-methylase RsmD
VAPLPVLLMCPAGFEEVVAQIATRDLVDFEATHVASGCVRGTSTATVRQLREFPCATNTFHVVASVPRGTLPADLGQFARALRHTDRPDRLPRRKSFRLRIHDDGRFASLDRSHAGNLETDLARWSGLRPSRSQADIEFWVVRRRQSSESVLATKLTVRNSRVDPGVLRPEVCAALARVAPLYDATLVIDPFAGSGALGIACLDAGARRVWLNDPSPGALRAAAKLRAARRTRVHTTSLDFRDLYVAEASVSAVVTDPPWGHYAATTTSLGSLYQDVARFAIRVLVTGGSLVVLTGAGRDATEALTRRKELALVDRFRVLINGRKAEIVHANRA